MKIISAVRESFQKTERTYNFTCDVCGREVFENERVCSVCFPLLPWNNGHICPLCGRKVKEEGICLECKQEPLRTDLSRAPLLHEGKAIGLVTRFKRGQRYLANTLAEIMLPTLQREFPDAEALLFVPMTEKARKKRGYNQSLLLAEELSVRSGLPVLDVSVKQHETEAQKSLGRRERQKNLERCFHIFDRAAVKGKTLVIVDDTLTTGATTSELADALKRAGAKKVYALTFTSVQNKNPFGKPPKENPLNPSERAEK